MSTQTLLLIDGHSMAFRSFFALPADSFRTAQGQYTNAVHGFLNTLLRLIKDHEPTHVAVAFDLPGGTFRTREYAEYKGGRAKTPEEFKGQIGVIKEVLDVVGISWLTQEDFEADDIVATLAKKGEAQGMKVFVASGDKDSFQLVDEMTTVVYPMPRSQMLLMDPAMVEERHGVPPSLYSDLAALVGESADNLPGVPLWGPKKAAKYLLQYGDLEGVIANVDEIPGKTGENLREHIDTVRLNRKLNRLIDDLPIGDDFEDFKPIGVDRTKLHELFDTLDFTNLRTRVLAELPAREGGEEVSEEVGRELLEAQPIALGSVALSTFFADHEGTFAILVDGSGKPGEGYVDRFAIAAQDGYVVFGSPSDLSQEDDDELTRMLADGEVRKISHAAKSMVHAFAGQGKEVNGISADTELDAYLLHPDQRKYDLDELLSRYLGIDVNDLGDGDTLGISADGKLVDDHLAKRAVALHDLRDEFMLELDKKAQNDDLVELELQVAAILAHMEARGIHVDQPKLEELRRSFDERVENAKDRAHTAIGDTSVNLSSPKQLQAVLFEQLNLPKTKKTKSGYTTNAEALADLLAKIATREDVDAVAGQEFLSALLDHRDAIKLRQSVEGLEKAVQADSRIRTTYQQTVAATGRLSSTEPNLQNIHARTEEGLRIREVFTPGEGFDYILTADYSQIEMRLMAHLSGDDELIEAFNEGADLHNYVAARVFGIDESEVTGAQRSKIKAMSYGLVYGLSAFGLSAQLGISVPEAQKLMDGYFSRFGNVKHYLDSLVEKARKDGYTETILGRRRYLPELTSDNRQLREAAERMALNAPIQGSAADIIKLAMLNVEHALIEGGFTSRVLLQVHDELVLEVVAEESHKVEELVRENMGNAWKLSVPLSVGVGIGRNWRDAAH